jgi:hypothetical protein
MRRKKKTTRNSMMMATPLPKRHLSQLKLKKISATELLPRKTK